VLKAFALRGLRRVRELADLISDINSRGERVYIYGASTRGGTIWQAAGLDVTDLPFAVERNPAKVGKKIASIGVPIISEDQARSDNPEYMLVSPWFFRDEFIEREKDYLAGGGKLIFPLPTLEVVG
jgi:NDP-4-keto-2,6-dideoxyhexose 3-C-methyltransferase